MRPQWIGSILQRLRNSEVLSKVLNNIAWQIGDKLLRMGVGLFVGVWVARYLGPEQFGKWNYAIAFSAIFGAMAGLGLDSLVVRELVRCKGENEDEIVGTTFYMRLAAAGLLCAVALGLSMAMEGDGLVVALVGLTTLSMVFQASNVVDFFFQSKMRSKNSVLAQNAAFVIAAVIRVVLLVTRQSLLWFAAVALLETILACLFQLQAYRRFGRSPLAWRFNGKRALALLRDGWPFILTSLTAMLYMRIDQVMLGRMLGPKEVGVFSAAVKISEIWYFIPMSIMSSALPIIVASKEKGEGEYVKRLQQLNDALFTFGLVVGLGMTFASPWVIALLYGGKFQGSAGILSLHIWSGVAICLGAAGSCWTLTENRQRVNIVKSVFGCVVNISLNLWLIPRMGARGAALASVVAQFATCLLFFDAFTFKVFKIQIRSILMVSYFKMLGTRLGKRGSAC